MDRRRARTLRGADAADGAGRLFAPAVATLVNRCAADGLARTRLTLASRRPWLVGLRTRRLLGKWLLFPGLALLLLLGPLL